MPSARRWGLVLALLAALALVAVSQGRGQVFPPQTPPPTAVIEAGLMIPGSGAPVPHTRILMRDGLIAAIGPDVAIPAGAVVYDLRGATVLPGLIDVHVHLAWHFGPDGKYDDPRETPQQATLAIADNLRRMLDAGFTTVQSVGEPEDTFYKSYVAHGVIPGPRILTAINPISGSPRIGNDDVLRARVLMLAQQRPDLVKIFASESVRSGAAPTLSLDQLQTLCGEANKLGLRTLVHAYGVSVHNATVAGCSEVEHGTYATQDDLNLMAARGTYFDPQVGLVIQNYLAHKAQYLGVGNYDEAGFAFMGKALALNEDLFKLALRTPGLKMPMGTDAVAGAFGNNADEIVARIHDGQAPLDAIAGATAVGADSLRMEKEIGSLSPGLQADIIALDGNPLTDASALKRVTFVMKGGEVYRNQGLPARP